MNYEHEVSVVWDYDIEETTFIALHRYKLIRLGYIQGMKDVLQKMEETKNVLAMNLHMHHIMTRFTQVDEMVNMLKQELDVLVPKHLQLDKEMEEYMELAVQSMKEFEEVITQQD